MPYSSSAALRQLTRRGIGLALLARAAVAVVILFAGAVSGRRWPAVPPHFSLLTAIVFAGFCGVLMLAEGARQNDLLFFANLGVRRWQLMLCAAGPALALEAIVSAAL